MPSSSKAQQRLFGAVLAAKRGELKGKPSGKVAELARRMDPESVRHFAATKTKNLPEKKRSNSDSEHEKSAEFLQRMFIRGYLSQMSGQ